jgi:hypothetical protein
VSAVEAAERRASITAFLRRNSGKQLTVADIAEALEDTVHATGRACAKMAADGLILHAGQFQGKQLYMDATTSGPPPEPKVKKRRAVEEVELVMGGVLVVVGRNEKTGRIRVTLEEV